MDTVAVEEILQEEETTAETDTAEMIAETEEEREAIPTEEYLL